ncbi:D-alanine--D-alanine ligase [Candidatus Roizmanbacteria bacterium CG_4_10_14_0_8_um_filter_39_9]|uniref:D-alanine--D-alanine ligase n=1 Tax=Candidatus Roizmanbacteria bacterium CG_4_10_14_0_8_um_filter_39_9 TaxID=1974829 RepID=A0A2M7QDL1_9BACT|nr:MAG: D-alanine--D-alanine ligase [Candidatus Roizmanbacteria bacterium CG_4_10_14_0_8_um_filter_39_9]
MKKITIAFLYNVRHRYPDPYDPRTQLEADFDDPITLKWIIKHFKNCGYNIIPIEADERAYGKLLRNRKRIDIAFNFSEGLFGLDREAQIPAILEILQIPYTGSSPLSQALMLNKAKAKEILIANNIATPPYQLFKNADEKLNGDMVFPLIVKPVSEGSGAGITNDSVVHTQKKLIKQITRIQQTFKRESVLVEPFLTGAEYSISMIGNPPRILPIISPNHALLPKGINPIDSFEVKWIFEEEGGHSEYLRCPAPLSNKVSKKVESLCFATWKALQIRDWCRMDVRCDAKHNPYVLEVNSPPGLLPPEVSTTSYFPLAAKTAGIEYEKLLDLIIQTALKRYKQ